MKRFILMIVAVVCLLLPMAANATETKPKILRVGFYYCEGYHEISQEGVYSGYGYELLQLIGRYENVKYEYVGYEKTWEEMLQLLKDGEIDFLTSGRKLEGREEEFDFSTQNIGFTSTALVIKAGNKDLVVGDYSTYCGLRVGMVRNSNNNDNFREFAREKGFTFETTYYDGQQELRSALQLEEVDAIVTDSLRKENADEWLIETFDEKPMYIMVRKGDKETLALVENALERMDRNEELWRLRLHEKFYQVDVSEFVKLSQEERLYLEKLSREGTTFKVLVNPDRFPYSYYEEEQMKGIMIDVFDGIATRAGIKYEYILVDDFEEYLQIIKEKKADICLDFYDDYYAAERAGYRITQPYLTAEYAWIKKKTFKGDIEKAGRIAYFASAYPSCGLDEDIKYIHFDTYTEALAAVRNGMVDAFCTYSFHAEHILWDGGNEDLMATYSFNDSKFAMGVSYAHENHLVSVLNKSANTLDGEFIDAVTRNHTAIGDQPFSIERFLEQYPFIIVLLFLFVCIVMVMAISARIQRNYQYQLVEAVQKADAANHAKTEFLARMSHDIRTPINGIMGMIDIAEKNTEDPAKMQECLGKMKTASWHLLQLVNDVLDMSKLESGRINLCQESINLEKLLGICVSIIEGQAEKRNLELEVQIEPMEHPILIGSELYINQIIVNILGNAVKYTNPGGRVSFRAKEISYDGVSATFCIEVEDNGIGMSPEFLEHIFEPFTQEEIGARSTYQGTGLGMSIAKSLVELMGGKLEVESTRDVGTKFTLQLALKVDNQEWDQEGSRGEATQGTGIQSVARSASLQVTLQNYEREEMIYDFTGLKVLLAEDVDLNREIAEYALAGHGAEVTVAVDGQEAVEIFRDNPQGTFDLVLMDIMMPRLNGLDATKVIRNMEGREDGREILIVAMTANAYATDVKRSKQAGMNAHLAKPIRLDNLYAVLQQCKIKKFEALEETKESAKVLDWMDELSLLGVETPKALRNLSGKKDLYQKLLLKYADMEEKMDLSLPFDSDHCQEMVEKVHALKGVTGNLAITPLYEYYNEILILLRKGEVEEANALFVEMRPVKAKILHFLEEFRK